MIIDKIETNIKRNLFLNEIPNIKLRSSDIYEDNTITINTTSKLQEFIGFGGAFTESAGYALSTINSDIYNNILDDYFSKEGLNKFAHFINFSVTIFFSKYKLLFILFFLILEISFCAWFICFSSRETSNNEVKFFFAFW